MRMSSPHEKIPARILVLPLLLITVLGGACNFAGTIPASGAPGSSANPNAQSSASAPAGGQGHLDCQAIGDAFLDFEGVYPTLGIVSNSPSADITTPGSPFYINFTKLRSDYDLLATLPDDSSFGKTSDAIAQFRQLTDLVESNAKSGAAAGSNSSQNPVGLYAKLSQPYIAVGDSFSTSCPNYTAPTVTPNP